MIYDARLSHNSKVIWHLKELAKTGQALGCYISVNDEHYEALPDKPFYKDKEVVWVSLGIYPLEQCENDGRFHLLMNVNDNEIRKIHGLFTKVIVHDGDLLDCERPYKNLGLLLRNHPESELVVEARSRLTGYHLNGPSWIEVETGAFATPYESDTAAYVSRKINVWTNELLPLLIAHLQSLFHKVTYWDTAAGPYGAYFDSHYSCNNYFELRGPKVAALMALPQRTTCDSVGEDSFCEEFEALSLDEIQANEAKKCAGDLELQRTLEKRMWFILPESTHCRAGVEILRSERDIRYPTHPVSAEVIEKMFTGFSQDQLDDFEAVKPTLKAKCAQRLAAEPSVASALEQSDAMGACQDAGHMSVEQVDTVRSICQGFKEGINNQAIADLFIELENDPKISSVIVTMLKEDWKNEGALIGTQIKRNRELLSTARRQEIITVARNVSVGAQAREDVEHFGNLLRKDVMEGRTVISSNFAKRFPAIYRLRDAAKMTADELPVWKREFQRLVNEVYLMQQVRSRASPHAQTGSIVENLILETMQLGSRSDMLLRAKKAEAEVEVIKLLMQGEGIEAASLDNLIFLLSTRKLQARLKAAGVEEPLVNDLIKVIHSLEEGYSTLCEVSAPWKDIIPGLSIRLPPLARRWLLLEKAKFVEGMNCSRLEKHIKSKEKILKRGYLELSDFRALKLRTLLLAQAKDGSLYKDIDLDLIESSAFYLKWSHRIVGEMIQGLDDTDSVLEEGVCFGTTSRWACNEQLYPHLTAQELVGVSVVGQVTAGDRFTQVFSNISVALVRDKDLLDLWPEQFRKQVGMKSVELRFSAECAASDMAKQLEVQIAAIKETLIKSHGVLLLLIRNHVIYIRIDEAKNIYRLGDTNVGILNFGDSKTPQEELYACFNELILAQYPDTDFILGVQIRL